MREYMIQNASAHVKDVFEYIQLRKFRVEVHLNRTRFWVPDGVELTEFLLKFGDVCSQVDPREDRVTGRLP